MKYDFLAVSLTYTFQGPLSFSSMAAQAFLRFGIPHGKNPSLRFRVMERDGDFLCTLFREGTALAEEITKNRRGAAHFLMDALSEMTGQPLGRWGYLLGMRPTKALHPFYGADHWRGLATDFLAAEKVEKETANLLLEAAECERALGNPAGTAAFYVHVPFCPSHCVYCSFPSAIVKSGAALDGYAAALAADIGAAGRTAEGAGLSGESFYMGGGTPTSLTPAQMDRVLAAAENLPLRAGAEKTVEAGRPDTITPEMLSVLVDRGVNRVSVNPQTMQDRLLAKISRSHKAADIARAMADVRAAGFQTVNMDFICGLPGQHLADMAENLDAVCRFRPENVTIHTLAVKRGSPFWGREKEFEIPGAAAVEEMLSLAAQRLRAAGYHPYYLYRQKYMETDFANVGWSLPGRESVYNIRVIGEAQHVIGAGAGSVTKAVLPGGHKLKKLYMPREGKRYGAELERLITERRTLFSSISNE